MKRMEIAPGASLSIVPGNKFKRCKITIHLMVPNAKETATEYSLLPNLLTRDCEKIQDPMQLSRYLFDLYGAEFTSESYSLGTTRVITLGVSGLKAEHSMHGEDLEKQYVDLLCELLFHPKLENGTFCADEVEIEKEKQTDFLRSEMNDKRSYCLKQARRKLFKDSPLGVESSGYAEDVSKITSASLYASYQNLLKTAQIEAVVVGMEPEKFTTALGEQLAKIEREPVVLEKNKAAENFAQLETFEEPMDTVQGKLCIMYTSGRVANAQQMAVMRVANSILGGLATSRLFTNVREKQSLCYYCASSFGGKAGVLTIDSGVDHANCALAAKAIVQEVETMQSELVTQEELKNAKDALTTAFVAGEDSISALENWVFTERVNGTDLSLEEFSALVNSVTPEQVRMAMAGFTPAVQYAIIGKGQENE